MCWLIWFRLKYSGGYLSRQFLLSEVCKMHSISELATGTISFCHNVTSCMQSFMPPNAAVLPTQLCELSWFILVGPRFRTCSMVDGCQSLWEETFYPEDRCERFLWHTVRSHQCKNLEIPNDFLKFVWPTGYSHWIYKYMVLRQLIGTHEWSKKYTKLWLEKDHLLELNTDGTIELKFIIVDWPCCIADWTL
jgi:hypothetical protein